MGPILTDLRTGITAFFAWWCGELAALTPRWIRRLFQGGGGGDLIVDISDGIVIRRYGGRSATEIAAAENLRQVLTFEMDRQTPFTAAQVYFDYQVTQRDTASGRLTVELTAVPRADVDSAIERAAGWSFAPHAVDIATNEPGAAPVINLLPGGAVHDGRGMGAVTVTLLVLALLLAIAAVAIPLDRDRREAEALTAQVKQVRTAALIAAKARDEITRLTSENDFLSDRRRKTRKTVAILDELTRLIPDHTWLQELRLQEKEVRLTGLSGGASDLVRVIEQSAYFSGARFLAPVTQDTRSGKERFTLSATVNPNGGAASLKPSGSK